MALGAGSAALLPRPYHVAHSDYRRRASVRVSVAESRIGRTCVGSRIFLNQIEPVVPGLAAHYNGKVQWITGPVSNGRMVPIRIGLSGKTRVSRAAKGNATDIVILPPCNSTQGKMCGSTDIRRWIFVHNSPYQDP